jgi:gentisate 1,2-dioxygenase
MSVATAPVLGDNRRKFYDRLAPQQLAPLWEVLKGLVPAEPMSRAIAHAWSFEAIRPLLMESGELLTAEEAERRVLVLENPALPGQSRITNSIYAGVQLIMPGEVAPAHRHTASALRFVLESKGGYTSVAGERTQMSRGDFIITPNMGWHDHGQEGDSPVIWVDGLDLHMINFFDAGFSDHYPDKVQPLTKQPGDSMARFGSGLMPFDAASPFGLTTPIFNYAYARSRAALIDASSATPDRHLAHTLRYANPLDGGWALPTIATWLTHLPKGFETAAMRSTDGQVFIVVEGDVVAEIGDRSFTLGESDIGVIPAWTARRLRASKEAIVFFFSDRSAQEKLGIWREQKM